ncbi:MAG: tRNA-intron lyase [archaeon]
MIKSYFVGDKTSSSSQEAFSMYEKSRWGEKKSGKIEYSGVEALYLAGAGRMEILSGKSILGFEELLKKLKKRDKRIETKLVVFGDLRKKGYIVKTALKFGTEFRVYEKGVKPGDDHARWVLTVVNESESLNWQDFAAKNRVAHSTRKKLLVAVVDEEGGVSYYEVSWTRL